MRVFLLDATLRQPTEVRFLLLDENGQKFVLTSTTVTRILHIVPHGEITQEWIEHVLFLLQKYSNGGMSRDFSQSIVRRRYMLPNGTLTAPTDVMRVECSGHLEFSKIESDQIAALFGLRTSLLEHILIENELRGWLEFNCDADCVVKQHARVYATANVSSCLRRSEEQAPPPSIRSVAIYRHNSTSFAYCTQDGKRHDDWLEAGELARVLSILDPIAVCAHGRHVLVGLHLNFPFIFIDTSAFVREHKLAYTRELDDAVPVVEEEKKPMVVDLEEDDDIEPIVRPVKFPGHLGKERCMAVFSIVKKTNAIDLTLEIARITGQPWSQTLRLESRLNRVEWMIMTFFHQHECVIPDPRRYTAPQQYTAGLVLDARVGIHSNVILLDFRSLYPSLVVEYDLCWSSDGVILPKMLDYLIERRYELSSQPGTEITCLCLKLLANTTYGALAYPAFRFYAPDIASTITAYGRQALQHTVAVVEQQFSCEVIYGDTDSVFVTTNRTDHMNLSELICSAVNANYKKLQLEFDGFYTKLLLLGKKCYVGYKPDIAAPPVVKGLLVIKKQSFAAGKKVCHFMIDQLRTAVTAEEYNAAIEATYKKAAALVDDLRENRLRRADLTVVNMLSQRLSDYGNVNIAGQYHVIAAKTSRVRYERGDYVQYIMFQGCTPIALDQIDDLPPVPVDVKWYCVRMHSMLEQILRVLPSTNRSSFSQLLLHNDRHEFADDNVLCGETVVEYTPRERLPLIVTCVVCRKEIEHWGLAKLDSILQQSRCDTILHWSPHTLFPESPLTGDIFFSCTACQCRLDLLAAARQLIDVHEIASVHANYDCKKTARQIDCDGCRRNLMQFFKTTGVLKVFSTICDELYLRIS